MSSRILLVVLALMPGVAFAKSGGGSGAAAAGLKSGNSLYGLCSQDTVNMDTDWNSGPKDARNGKGASYCQDIEETLDTQMGCSVGVQRKGKYTLSSGETIADQLAKNEHLVKSLEEACGSKIEQIKNDPTKFKLFLKQLFAVLFIQENEWRSEPTSYMGAQGLGQLDPKSVKAYGRCNKACGDIGRTSQTKGGANHIGDHNNVKCTVAIGLYYMGIDGVMGEGSGDNGSYGIARYFQPFRKIDTKNRAWMMPKLRKYCNERIDQESPSNKSQGGTTTVMIDNNVPSTFSTTYWAMSFGSATKTEP